MWLPISFFVVILPSITHGQDEGLPCIQRTFDQNSFVCVCNATYCDTLPRPSTPMKGQFAVYTSDLSSKRFFKSVHDFEPGSGGSEAPEVVNFKLGSTSFQAMLGWGGAFTDSASLNILTLSTEAQDMLLRSYFSESGIEYTIGRINMGGCDFSWRAYTCDDFEGDVSLEKFELQPEDLDYKIPVIKRAAAMSEKGINIFASPWSAPPWMKTNNDYVGYGQLLKDMYQPWANYFIKFLDGYAENGVKIWGVTAENEPTAGYVPDYHFNCMGFTAEEERVWVSEYLGPTLEAHGYGDVVLMINDDQRQFLPERAETVLNGTEALKYVDGIAVHWYSDGSVSPEKLTSTHEKFPDYFILGTEACQGFAGPFAENPVRLGFWDRLETYAHDILEDVNHWVAGWTEWNLAVNMEGGPNWANMSADGPIIVNPEKDEFYKNPMFYGLGHFSKFVKQGAVRLELTSDDPHSLESAAFRNEDGTRVVIILNRSETELDVRVQVEDQGTMVITVGPRSLQTALFA
ncbi:lysosomal acid glucosylceramidase-like [Macrobrachium rosenbergii]|uniref:lysosomal acid glucosylceramidase-like n=1 Tax=Macrobrachium rosenbergii TaxID=79674 RepID=UPI0034D4230C